MVFAALRGVHGACTIEHEVSLYYITNELALTFQGMMIAIPEQAWSTFRTMSTTALAATLLRLAQKVRLKAFRKSPRGPKKPRLKREGDPKRPHVSTAKLLMGRKDHPVAP